MAIGFDNLNIDVLTMISINEIGIWKVFSEINKLTNLVFKKCINEANIAIVEAFPALKPSAKPKSLDANNPLKIFMRLINNLKDEADRLECKLSNVPESIEYLELMEQIKTQTEVAKKAEFNKFIMAIAEMLALKLPDGLNPEIFWNETLRDDTGLLEIKTLDFSYQNLKFLPKEIFVLSNLDSLFLNNNSLMDFPTDFEFPPNLTILNLSYNKIRELPSSLSSLKKLRNLRISDNQLVNPFPILKNLSSLNYLDLGNNPISVEGKTFSGVSSLLSIKHLSLASIGLNIIPDELLSLPNLENLLLVGNKIENITLATLNSFKKLTIVYLYNNPLTEESKENLEKSRMERGISSFY